MCFPIQLLEMLYPLPLSELSALFLHEISGIHIKSKKKTAVSGSSKQLQRNNHNNNNNNHNNNNDFETLFCVSKYLQIKYQENIDCPYV